MKTVYVVRYGEYSDQGIAGVFSNEKLAQKYCDIKNSTRNFGNYYPNYWVDEYVLDKDAYDLDTRVEKYYEFTLWFEGGKITDTYSGDSNNRIYTMDTVIEEGKEYITVYSVKSSEHAKKVAYEQFQIKTQQALEDGKF